MPFIPQAQYQSPWSQPADPLSGLTLMTQQQQLNERYRQQMLNLRALQQQQLMDWRRQQLVEGANYRTHLLRQGDERTAETVRSHKAIEGQNAPLRVAQTDASTASAERSRAAVQLDAAKEAISRALLENAQVGSKAAGIRAMPYKNPLDPGGLGMTAAGAAYLQERDQAAADIQKALMFSLLTNPNAAERLMEPMNVPQAGTAVNKLTGGTVAEGQPRVPAAGRSEDAALAQLFGSARQGYSDITRMLPTLSSQQRSNTVPIMNLYSNLIQSLAPRFSEKYGMTNAPTAATAQAPAEMTFDSEEAARSAGHGSGARVRIKGIGLVELN